MLEKENNMTDNYYKVEKALTFIEENFKKQPSLQEIAQHIHLSPHHFQRIFKEWAGVSPKKYLQFLSVNYAKKQLKNNTIFDTAIEGGFSSTSRLHDLFVNIEGMTPGEYRNQGAKLHINYSFAESPFGNIFIASTPKGVCFMVFTDTLEEGITQLRQEFPKSQLHNKVDQLQQDALLIFQRDWSKLDQIKLHLKGTTFQLKVWEALLSIPEGKLATYGHIATAINQPKAARAVGTAIGANPIAFLIPCHRVIQSSGKTGGYRWNPIRKKAIIAWEGSKLG